MPFKKMIAVYCGNHAGLIYIKCNLMIVETGGAYNYHWALMD
jgi:hypothetical protein